MVDRLILDDEKLAGILIAKIGGARQRGSEPVQTEGERQQIETWRRTLATLRQGIEGLRLKTDALLDRTVKKHHA